MGPRNRLALGTALLVLGTALPSRAQSAAGCRRAEQTVADVLQEYSAGSPDHKKILERLMAASNLCPSSGEVFRLLACSGEALKDPRVNTWRDRAVMNRASSTGCEGVLVAAKPTPAPLPSYVRQKFALIVGIGKFRDPTIPTLQYPSKDARDLAQVLADTQYGRFGPGNVRVLTDEEATRGNILDALQDLILKAHEDDLVLLYMSSHGSPNKQETGLAGVGYIVTYDTTKQSIWRDALEYQSFADKVSLIKARRKVMFLDTCYSGQVTKAGHKNLVSEGAGIGEATAKLLLSGEGTFVVASSRDNERSWESERFQNGYFTYYLMEAIKKGKEQPLTVKEIFASLSASVAEAVAREKQEPQHPAIYPATGPADVRIGVMPTEGTSLAPGKVH